MDDATGFQRISERLSAVAAPCFALDLEIEADGATGFRISAFNAPMERLAGVSAAEVAGRRVEEVLGEGEAGPALALARACVASRRARHCTHAVTAPAGRMLWRTALLPLFGARGMVHGVVGSASAVVAAAPETDLTLHGDILYYNALARMPLSKMMRAVQMRRMDPTPIDEATGRLLDLIERLSLAAEEAVEATESAAKAARREVADAQHGAEMWRALFDSVGGR